MVKAITLSAVVLLLIGSSAFGQINVQWQNWNATTTNGMEMHGGPGSITTTQGVGTLNIQSLGINPDLNGDPLVTASQGIGAAEFQTASLATDGAHMGVTQSLSVAGFSSASWDNTAFPAGQTQQVGDLAGPVIQHEGATMAGGQTLEKGVGSAANAEGINLLGFGMGQSAQNSCADGFQLSIVVGGQYSAIDGAAQSTGIVDTDVTVTVEQVQVANDVVGP